MLAWTACEGRAAAARQGSRPAAADANCEAAVAIPCPEGGSEAPELAPCFFPELELFQYHLYRQGSMHPGIAGQGPTARAFGRTQGCTRTPTHITSPRSIRPWPTEKWERAAG